MARLRTTPAQVKAVWDGMADPRPRAVAAACEELYGEEISHWTVIQWEKDGFDLEKIEARTMAFRASKRRRAAQDKLATLEALHEATDDNIIRDAGRQGMITAITLFRMIQRNAKTLVTSSPKDAGTLILAVAKAMGESAAMYERAISLAERALKMDDPRQIEGTAEEVSPDHGSNGSSPPKSLPEAPANDHVDPLENVLVRFQRESRAK